MFLHGSSAFSAGPMSSSHAAIGQRCEVCHVPVVQPTSWTPSLGMRRKVPDSACLSCHNVAGHHPALEIDAPSCGSCHVEHVGAMHLAAVADGACTQCHAALTTKGGGRPSVATKITNFGTDHPEFRPLRYASNEERAAALALKFNHAAHMLPDLRGPKGPQALKCETCHYSVMTWHGRATPEMSSPSFEMCKSCHTLEFDTHIPQEAPHANPDQVRAFVEKAITEYAQAHPQVVAEEIRHWPAEAPLPGKAVLPPPHTEQEWVANRVRRSEIILWRMKCSLCHRDVNPESAARLLPADLPLPEIEPAQQPWRWMADAEFSHPAHQAVACAECHTKALTSVSGADVLMPTIATCRRCHDGQSSPQGPPLKAGHAESGCFLCHFYHAADEFRAKPQGRSLGELLKQ
jgi:hypothetical protein